MFHSNNCRLISEESEDKKFHKVKAVVSSTAVDTYFTHMTMRSLRNYRDDAKQGVQLKDSHLMNNGFGTSTDAKISKEELIVDFQLMRNQPLNAPASYPNSDDFARAIKEGIINDVSIGFYGGKRICDICEDNWRKCYHWPGIEYEIEDRGTILCTAAVDDARLAEVSTVFDGSNPDAVILERANRCISEGQIDDKTLYMLTERYGVRFNEGTTGYSIPKRENKTMDASKERIEILEKSNADLKELSERQEAKIETLQKTIEDNKELVELGKEARSEKVFNVKKAYKNLKSDRGDEIDLKDLEYFDKRLAGMSLSELRYEQQLYESLLKGSEKKGGKRVEPGEKTEISALSNESGLTKEEIFG